MEIDNISKKKAKEILDFLAQKVGYDYVMISANNRLLLIVDEKTNTKQLVFVEDQSGDALYVNSPFKEYKEYLSKMLDLSASGKDLVFYDAKDWQISSVVTRHVFLKKHSCLEQILISLDIMKNERN